MILDPSESSHQAGREEPSGNPTGSSKTRDTTDFQVVILAGGLGTRMQPITSSIPKPMIPVKGNPFLHYQLELLARFGLRRVLMLVAYLGEKIEAHFGTGKALGIELAYCYEPTPLGTGGALKNAEAQLESEFIVLNGDTYLPIDYTALLRSFREQNTCAMIVAYRPSSEASSELVDSLPSNLAVSAGGRVTAYRKRDPRGLTHVDAGVLVLRKEVLNKIPRSRACSLEEEVFPQMITQGQMEAWVTSVPFYDMGTPAGLEALAARLP
jgi:NDP-sugar pyrophosphorylase family protein